VGDPQATQWVATLVGVSKAIRKTDASKVITFHSPLQRLDLALRYLWLLKTAYVLTPLQLGAPRGRLSAQ